MWRMTVKDSLSTTMKQRILVLSPLAAKTELLDVYVFPIERAKFYGLSLADDCNKI